MAATASPATGLSDQDVARIRETLAAGRKPKVMFTAAAGQIAGQTGQVVRLTDPAESDEWLVVRFGHDELPFSPRDLTVPPPRTKSTRRSTPPHPRKEAPVPDTATDSSAPQAAAPESSATKADTETSADAKPAADGAKSSAASKTTSGSKPVKAAKAAKPKSPPGLTVTLAYQDGEWTVAAQQGAKTLAKPYLVKPAEALKMVGMVDVPGVQEAVSQLVANERAEAEQRAEALRAQLTELETHLAELRDAT